MIKSIEISDVATFGKDSPAIMHPLAKINFLFGANGTGKTTISRVLAGTLLGACKVQWHGDLPLERLVYNRDFVENNFRSESIKGVFTLGKEDIGIRAQIDAGTKKIADHSEQLRNLQDTLSGSDNAGGKQGELDALNEKFNDKCWSVKKSYNDPFKMAFKGFNTDKAKFSKAVLEKIDLITPPAETRESLKKKYDSIFIETPTKEEPFPLLDTAILKHESNPVLSKCVLGKTDVDIADMIHKLGNSDWVKAGQAYYAKTSGACPFCQQDTPPSFAQSLRAQTKNKLSDFRGI